MSASSADRRFVLLEGTGPTDGDPAVVGAKAANLIRMADAGLAVPPGFVLTTGVCADYQAAGGRLGTDVEALLARGVRHLEAATGRRFGGPRRPLLVSVRSGAPISMPGMLDTVLNVGLNDSGVGALVRATGDPAFAWDAYRRLIGAYAEIVDGCSPEPFAAAVNGALARTQVPAPSELDVADLRNLVAGHQGLYRSLTGRPFPQDPYQQLLAALEAVLRSWNAPRAVEYRRLQGLEELPGTAVTVQAMVFGNLGVTSGSGVGFTRNPATGDDELYVDFVVNGQGEDVVGGRQPAHDPMPALAAMPGLADQLDHVRRTLEAVFADAQDFEFTVEESMLWLLQTRPAKRSPLAALRIACDLVDEGLIGPATAVERLRHLDLDAIIQTRLSPGQPVEPMGHATPASGGVAAGPLALDVDTALQQSTGGDAVILVRHAASTDDIAALAACRGLLTATGTRTSHAAVVARHLGLVCLVNCSDLRIDLTRRTVRLGKHQLRESEGITIDATTGHVYPGALRVTSEPPTELIRRVRGWETTATA